VMLMLMLRVGSVRPGRCRPRVQHRPLSRRWRESRRLHERISRRRSPAEPATAHGPAAETWRRRVRQAAQDGPARRAWAPCSGWSFSRGRTWSSGYRRWRPDRVVLRRAKQDHRGRRPIDEPYIYFLPDAGPAEQVSFPPVQVPQGHLWVMGDSRNDSIDSRAPGNAGWRCPTSSDWPGSSWRPSPDSGRSITRTRSRATDAQPVTRTDERFGIAGRTRPRWHP